VPYAALHPLAKALLHWGGGSGAPSRRWTTGHMPACDSPAVYFDTYLSNRNLLFLLHARLLKALGRP
jgi:hypothetical protein